ncbi:MAG: ROK family protein [Candidatus Saccharimonadales bacterium]
MYATVDIGGTKTLLAIFNGEGSILEQVKFPTPPTYENFILELQSVVQKLNNHDFVHAGIAIPGKVDRQHGVGVAFGNLPWENVDIQADCEKVFHCPATVENDANLAGLSEALLIKDTYQKVLYITISTGIGIGYIVNEQIEPAFADSEAGEIIVEHDGHLVHWESFASGKAIVAKYGKRASDLDDPKAWQDIARDFAVGMLDLIAIAQPEIILVGGGVGSHFKKYDTYLRKELDKYETPLLQIPIIKMAKRPEEAVIYGCFELAQSRYAAITS